MPETTFTCLTRKRECHSGVLFQDLLVWQDSEPRSGPENMAVDEALVHLGHEEPILRLYFWKDDWVSLGYFQSLKAARAIFGEEINYVRRWTGGGVVDHRNDLTYSLIIPKHHPAARLRGGESYLQIHQAVAECLRAQGIECELTSSDSSEDSVACFQKPVTCDIIAGDQKIAGAGQRRGRWGVLHQGSVLCSSATLERLALALATRPIHWVPSDDFSLSGKYSDADWLQRVP